ncbi:uncharacterized protein OCT59_005628 [Rhizophagus irregularis]|uniref:uncharacterized protein n=1 Tax=Rhizophagus irregularis TaxID=588596 RepID=UPI003332DE37|nr:hypothetical protein OCT59_005628 [Rhizophagus irregularis]
MSNKTEYYSEEEESQCPLCMEEMDLSDRNFRPCPCGYQICRFCWHHIQETCNGRCPACRRVYSEQTIEFKPISAEELTRIKNEKKQKEREKKELEAMNRKHLANMRVVQKNLVYVIGLSPKIANEEILRSHDYFGQYGKIAKIVVNRRNPPASTVPGAPAPQPSVGVYITYVRKEDAARAIAAVDGSMSDGKVLRASYGTTKYCTYYLRSMVCQNPNCMYLHEPGEEADSYTKEDLASVKYHLKEHTSTEPHKVQLGRPPSSGTSNVFPPQKKSETPHRALGPESDKGSNDEREEASALPPTASWATKSSSTESTPVLNNKQLPQLQSTPSQHSSHSVQPQSSSHTLQHPPSHVTHTSHPPSQPPQNSHHLPHLPNSQNTSSSPSQEQKSKRNVAAESSGLKATKKVEPQPVQNSVSASKRKETQIDIEHEKPQQLVSEPIQETKLQEQVLPSDSLTEQSNDKFQQIATKQDNIVADFDQTLSVLSDGSFSFSFNAPLLENSVVPEEKNNDKISPITSDNVAVGGSCVVSPPPGVGFRTDFPNSNTNPDYVQPTPTQYTGSFNPFATDDDKFDPFATDNQHPSNIIGLSSLNNNNNNIAGTYTNDSRSHSSHGQSSSSKSRQSSRFGFALEDGDNAHFNSSDPLAMKDLQEGFRALFPNVNISFGPSDVHQESMWNTSNDSTFGPLRRPLFTTPPGVPITSTLNQTHSLHNTNASVGLDSLYHQNMLIHQPIIPTTSTPTIKSPPPGIYTPTPPTPRMDFNMTSGWNPQNVPWNTEEDFIPRHPSHQNQQGSSRSRDEAQDFFGAWLKAAAASSNTQDDIPNEAEPLPNILQDPAIMSVRISQADSAYRAPGAPVMPQYQPMQNVGSHRLSVFERLIIYIPHEKFFCFLFYWEGLNDASKEIQTTSIPSERSTEIEKESNQSLNVAHVKSPSFSAEDTVTKKSNNDNLNQSTKPTSVKVISIKSKSTSGNNSQQQSKFANEPSGQSKSPNDNTTQKSDSSSATYTLNVTNISSRRRDRHSRNSSAHNNRSAGGNSSLKDSKKHGNVDVQISSSKSNDTSNQKGSSATSITENKKSSTNESTIVPSPILSKKPKKKDKNTSARKVLSNSVNNNNIKKDAKANEDTKSAENNAIGQKYVGNPSDNLTIDTKEFQSGASFTGEINNSKMPADFKFDFESSPLFISLPPSISGPKNYQNDESGPNLSAFESSSLDFKSPTSTTFDLFSKDFNINTSSIFNLQTSFSSAFGSSNNNPPGSPTLNNGNANLWTDPNPSNSDTMINSNGSNGVKTTTASVEDLERQVANARREAEVLELRLRAVIKKNTHHLQDAWKS